jgi:peptidyl-prolyl isomerase E (cyclophilin E)
MLTSTSRTLVTGGPHKGFAFLTFNSAESALDAIDNMHRNTLPGPSNVGRPLKVNLAKAPKPSAKGGNNKAIWDDEEWIKEHGTVPVEQRAIGTEGTD